MTRSSSATRAPRWLSLGFAVVALDARLTNVARPAIREHSHLWVIAACTVAVAAFGTFLAVRGWCPWPCSGPGQW